MSAAVPAPAPKRTTDRDIRIGARIRARRELMRLSQTDLGNALGVSFQQVQKYELGTNRIGAGRLEEVAELLGAPVASFYDEPGPVRVPEPLSVAEARAAQRAATSALEEAVRREAAARGEAA
ncbi:helix-turn-helix domain-containing protein [Methylobacterium sp. NMS14P]|uniref:helix-turn-helix domain-containing protein n=1 Tax=Methylobacterium sp. NMS14P TaxID=2894310 RepID=UPI00235A0E9F|nr:helix-turn-helix transcriptional regulator [Methylobacterium sp. NMS14P]WCS27278.1 helix-turn-helix domain-containing protein [Methylobacterium sp. NMS14P]